MKTALAFLSCSALIAFSSVRAADVWLQWAPATQITDGAPSHPVQIASAPDFDRYLNALPTNASIHLLAGTFLTETHFTVKSGWTLAGAGMDKTVLRVADLGPKPLFGKWWQAPMIVPFCSGLSQSVRDVHLRDLTVDCNFDGQTYVQKGGRMNIEAVSLHGENLRLERIKVIHFGCTSRDENFVIALSYQGKVWTAASNAIDSCVVTDPAKLATFLGGITCLGLGGLPKELAANAHETDTNAVRNVGPGWSVDAEVKHCQIYGFDAPATGIGVGYQAQCNIFANHIWDCPKCAAVYGENTAFDGWIVANNVFSNVARGFLMDDYGFENVRLRRHLLIRHNVIENISSLGISMVSSFSPKSTGLEDVTVLNNFIAAGAGHPAIRIQDATNVVVSGNILSGPGDKFQIWLEHDAGVSATNNRNVNGSKVAILRQ